MADSPPDGTALAGAAADLRPSAGLRRMRAIATGLLLLMLALFVLSSMLQARHPWLGYVRAFAEAATVGASADWFAVVALFRHPLGIPIPHTAIVPRSKQRIGQALGRFICNNFLAPEVISARLQRFDAAAWLAHWLTQPGNAALVTRRSSGALPLLLELLGHERMRAFARGTIRKGIDSFAAAPMAARTLGVLVAQGHDQQLFDLGLEMSARFLEQNRETLREKVSEHSVAWLPEWVDLRIADMVLVGLSRTLAGMRQPDHPYREEARAAVERLTQRLAEDPEMYERCEQIKAKVLDNAVVESYLEWLADEIRRWIEADTAAPESAVMAALVHALQAVGKWLEEDQPTRERINRWLRESALDTVVPNRNEIGAFIAEEVERWDAQTLVARAENQLGRDLQFIRINGTVVGGLVGLLIYLAQGALG
jgi:uncharacterized membrane-anchored protein YjiN (DUF445 family)